MGKNDYEKQLSKILKSVAYERYGYQVKKISKDRDIRTYVDPYITQEQDKRDKSVTKLLNAYVESYESKRSIKKFFQVSLFILCIAMLLALSIFFGIFISIILKGKEPELLRYIVELTSICITFVTLMISVLKIIAKYIFDEKDEEYITRIVEIIQNNDLANKKENIKANGTKAIDDYDEL